MTPEQESKLLDDFKKALARIEQLEDWQEQHTGIDVGFAGKDFPHPYQKVSVLEFGKATGRADVTGVQLLAGTVENPIGYRILNEFILDPNNIPSSVYGFSVLGKLAAVTDMAVVDGISTEIDDLTTATDIVSIRRAIGAASSELTLTAKDGSDTAQVALLAATGTDVRRFYLTDTSFTLAQVASDGAVGTVNDGSMWYRTDTDQFRGVRAGSTLNFLMEGDVSGLMELIVKDANETVNNSSTLQDDNDLLFAIASGEKWQFEGILIFDGHIDSNGFKMAFTGPTGAVGAWGALGGNNSGSSFTPASAIQLLGAADTIAAVAVNTHQLIRFWGSVANSTNAGNLKLQWAQQSAHASNLTLYAGSYIKYQLQ